MSNPSDRENDNFSKRILSSEEWHFAKETLKNVLIFFFWAFVALLIQVFVKWIENNWDVAPFFINALIFVEHAILVADVCWFVIRLTVDTIKVIVRGYYEVKLFIIHYREKSSSKQRRTGA